MREETERYNQVNPMVKELHLGPNNIEILKLDLTSLESVREFAKEVTKIAPKIDLLINSEDQVEEQAFTQDGFEKNFQINYLGISLAINF